MLVLAASVAIDLKHIRYKCVFPSAALSVVTPEPTLDSQSVVWVSLATNFFRFRDFFNSERRRNPQLAVRSLHNRYHLLAFAAVWAIDGSAVAPDPELCT